MFDAIRRPQPISDQISILWWRLVILVTRHLQRAKVRAQPVVTPVIPLLWLPLLALVFGVIIGWMIAVA